MPNSRERFSLADEHGDDLTPGDDGYTNWVRRVGVNDSGPIRIPAGRPPLGSQDSAELRRLDREADTNNSH